MTDISNIFDYKDTFPVEIKAPNGKPVGITIHVKPLYDKALARARDISEYERLDDLAKRSLDKATPELQVEYDEKRGEKTYLAMIDSWDFGDKSFGELSNNSECNTENKLYLIRHKGFQLIAPQLVEASANHANFTLGKSKK